MPRTKKTSAEPDHHQDMILARKGDREAFNRFLQWLDEDTEMGPRFAELLSQAALGHERSLLEMIFGEDDLLMQEMGRRRLVKLQRELGSETGTPLERLLIERISLCWLQMMYFETLYAQNSREMSRGQMEFQQKRIDMAHRRYLGAIKSLAQVRRLQVPAMQVNIGEKQINVVQGSAVQASMMQAPAQTLPPEAAGALTLHPDSEG